MRIQYQSKMYSVKKYDLENDIFLTDNDIELTSKDIRAIVLNSDEFNLLESLNPSKEEMEEVVMVDEKDVKTVDKKSKKS